MKGILVLILSVFILNVNCYKTENELDYECPETCPKIIDPLCAFDGNNKFKYFHNECLMRYNKCRNGNSWTPTHMTLCLHQIDPIVLQECLRPCPFIYDPVCASNGEQTEVFGNNCIYEMENALQITNGNKPRKMIVVFKKINEIYQNRRHLLKNDIF